VPCHASTDVSCLPFFLSAALRLQLHSKTMRLQARLAERKKYGAISRHLTHGRTLGENERGDDFYHYRAAIIRKDLKVTVLFCIEY